MCRLNCDPECLFLLAPNFNVLCCFILKFPRHGCPEKVKNFPSLGKAGQPRDPRARQSFVQVPVVLM